MGCGLSIEKKELNLSNIELAIDTPIEKQVPYLSFNNVECKARVVDVCDGDVFIACLYYGEQMLKFKCRAINYTPTDAKNNLNNFNREKVKDLTNQEKLKFMHVLNFTVPNNLVTLHCKEFDKYGRLLCEVYVDDVNIQDITINDNFEKIVAVKKEKLEEIALEEKKAADAKKDKEKKVDEEKKAVEDAKKLTSQKSLRK